MPKAVILLIEDEEAIAEMLRGFFERDDYRFLHVATGEEGLERLRQRPVDVVLLDLTLPGMDGIDVCRKMRHISEVPVIMLTARDTEVDKVLGLEIGADDYVTKPFSPRELLARVKAILRRVEDRATRPKSILGVGSFEVDTGRREIRTPTGDSIRPTAKEFDLLQYLAENLGLALTRSQILSSVWGYDYFGETRTVDVHVRQLRKKIPGLPLETVWGVGYRLEG